MGSSSAFSTPTAVCGKLVDRPPWPPQPRVDCSKPIWTSSWADHQQPALVHLPLTLCDRPLGPLLLPLLLHQVTLEQGAVSNAAAVATEGQQRRHAPMQELQHTRFPWQLARLALHQRHVLRHPPPPPSTVLTWSIKFVERKASIRPSFCQLDGKGGSVESINESEVRHGDASSPSPSSSLPSTTPTLRAQKLRMVCTGCWNTWEAILTNNAGSRRCHEDICIDDSWRRADMERCFRSAQDHPVS